jgi:hypothetical protein
MFDTASLDRCVERNSLTLRHGSRCTARLTPPRDTHLTDDLVRAVANRPARRPRRSCKGVPAGPFLSPFPADITRRRDPLGATLRRGGCFRASASGGDWRRKMSLRRPPIGQSDRGASRRMAPLGLNRDRPNGSVISSPCWPMRTTAPPSRLLRQVQRYTHLGRVVQGCTREVPRHRRRDGLSRM